MILAIDVYYFDLKAKVVGLIFEKWDDAIAKEIVFTYVDEIEKYESGNFYKRELPCIIKLLGLVDLPKIEFIIIDGYIYINDEGGLGLGGHLFEKLNENIPIIGVAKTSFFSVKKSAVKNYRGKSKNPLYISAIGIDISTAARFINNMHGAYRIPTLLKLLDQETKKI
jgi:deoxyribonuclease V